jgi:small-conductance mechanosensitive channel
MMGSVHRPLEERISVQHVSAHRPASSHKLVALGVAGLAGTIVYPYAVMAVQLLQHGDGSSQAVSQLVHGRDGVVVALATVVLGLSSLAIASALRAAGPQTDAARAGRFFLRAWGVCAVLWGAFPVDRDGASASFLGSVHAVAGGIGFACLVLALLAVTRGLRSDPYWRALRLPSLVVALVALGALYYALRLHAFDFADKYRPPLQRFTLGAMAAVVVLAAAKAVDTYLICRIGDTGIEYNLRRVLRLVVVLALVFIALSILFANWYTAVVSLGLISLILGFALQTPITSLIGWIYILLRTPYRVGDRIRIGEASGDVIDVGYLDTTLWEFGGQYLSTDHPSGRIIKFPNSDVLSTTVYNYSWPLFPYIWNEIKFNIAYESDLDFVAKTMQAVAEEEIGEAMMQRVKTFRGLLAQTPVDELEVRERPSVFFRVSENTWLEAILRYVVPPREAGRVKNRLITKLLARLNAAPDRVMFPKSNAR